jgi:toxin ParE1/3/4
VRELWVTRAAEADLLEIWNYLFDENPEIADKIINRIAVKLDQLLSFPFSGNRRPEFGDGYYSVVVGNYVTFYRVSETKIEVSRVLHGARDLSRILQRDDEDGDLNGSSTP